MNRKEGIDMNCVPFKQRRLYLVMLIPLLTCPAGRISTMVHSFW
jgi:hypothetical protein